MSPLRASVLLIAGSLIGTGPLNAQSPADKAGVTAAVLDYVEGFYEGDSTRFIRSVRPEVDKFGFWKNDKGAYQGGGFPWTRFFSFARDVKSGKTKTPPNAPKQIQVLDVQDQTAAAKLTAYWGTDYFLLAKYDGKWMIRQIMWQSLPPTP